MEQRAVRVGLMVPSDNTLLESELAPLLAAGGGRFSLHGSRYRVRTAARLSVRAVAAQRERCVLELSDTEPDVLLHVDGALCWDGDEAAEETDGRIAEQLATSGLETRVRSVTRALVALVTGRGPTAVLSPRGLELASQVAARLDTAGADAVPAQWPNGDEPGQQADEIIAQAHERGFGCVLLAAAYEAPCSSLALAVARQSGLMALTPALAAAWAISSAAGRDICLPAAITADAPLVSRT